MAITEQQRHQLFTRLEQTLGAEEAATLMEHLPPVGWADVATKRDLDALPLRDAMAIEAVSSPVRGQARAALREQTRTLIYANLGYVTAFGSLVLGGRQALKEQSDRAT